MLSSWLQSLHYTGNNYYVNLFQPSFSYSLTTEIYPHALKTKWRNSVLSYHLLNGILPWWCNQVAGHHQSHAQEWHSFSLSLSWYKAKAVDKAFCNRSSSAKGSSGTQKQCLQNDYFSMPHYCNKVVFFDWVCRMLINETLGISGIFQITRAVEQWVHLTTLTLFYPSLDLKWFTTKQEQNKTKPKGKKKKIFKRKQKEAQVPQKADVITNLLSWRHFKNANYSSSSQRVQRADNCFLSIFIWANSRPKGKYLHKYPLLMFWGFLRKSDTNSFFLKKEPSSRER